MTTQQRRDHLIHWAKLLWMTACSQVAVQALGFAAGLIIIHLLPIQEYALYTLASSMLATMTVLADGGISTGVMAQGAQVWQDRARLGGVLASGLQLRKRYAMYWLAAAVPVLLILLHHHGASWPMAALIGLCLIPAFTAVLSGSLLEIVPRLRQEIASLQLIQVQANAGRLALIGITLFAFPKAFVALCASGCPQFWTNHRLREISGPHADLSQPTQPEVTAEILRMVRRILPGTIYYCISGQITIFIIAVFGSSQSVAQVGALTRLAAALNLIGALFNTLVLPRFVRKTGSGKFLLGRFFKLQAGLGLIFFCITLVAFLFPSQVIWILGKNYGSFSGEVVFIVTGSCLAMIGGMTYHLCTSLGHVLSPSFSIGISLSAQIMLLVLNDCSTVHGIFMFSIYSALIQYLMWFIYFIYVHRGNKL